MQRCFVDADNLLKKMQERYDDLVDEYGYYDNFTQGYEEALLLVENATSIDVQEVKHGRWIGMPIDGYCDCKCSICGEFSRIYSHMKKPRQKYCPVCGAKMDKTE